MTNDNEDILRRELGKTVNKFVPHVTSDSENDSLASAAMQLAARYLSTETHTERLVLGMDPENALRRMVSVLGKLGKLKAEDSDKTPYPSLKAVVGSGFLNMNPAVVYLEILQATPTACEITVTGLAKEGVIKQRTAAKAVQRVIAALR